MAGPSHALVAQASAHSALSSAACGYRSLSSSRSNQGHGLGPAGQPDCQFTAEPEGRVVPAIGYPDHGAAGEVGPLLPDESADDGGGHVHCCVWHSCHSVLRLPAPYRSRRPLLRAAGATRASYGAGNPPGSPALGGEVDRAMDLVVAR